MRRYLGWSMSTILTAGHGNCRQPIGKLRYRIKTLATWSRFRPVFKNKMTSISKLIVGGFKSIRDRTEIPIAPLTLLFGPNSAGKSSVMDAMDALRQRLEDARFLHTSNVMSASEDLNQNIIYFNPNAHRIGGEIPDGAATSMVINLGVEISEFSAPHPEFGGTSEATDAGKGVFLELDGADLTIELNAENRQSEIISKVSVDGHALIRHVSPTWVVREGLAEDTVAQLSANSAGGAIWRSRELGALVIDLSNPKWAAIDRAALDEADDFFDQRQGATRFKEKLQELKTLVENSQSPLVRQLVKINSGSLIIRTLTNVPANNGSSMVNATHTQIFRAESWLPDGLDFAQRGDLIRLLSVSGVALAKREESDYLATEALVDWIVTAANALTHEVVFAVHKVLDRSVISGDRSVLTVEDVTVRSDDSIFNCDPPKSGSNLKKYALALGRQQVQAQLTPDAFSDVQMGESDFVNDVLSGDLFGAVVYKVTPKVWKIDTHLLSQPDEEIHDASVSVLKVRLFLKDSNGRLLNFDEVGSGISYVMPVLASLWDADMSWLSQPELHLHPAAQCDLGDVLIRAFHRKHFSVTETHSEHLLLRILRRIRQTSSGVALDPELKCRPEYVSVLYFEPKGDGSTQIRQLRVSHSGDFMDRWPKGFFTERDAELFDE